MNATSWDFKVVTKVTNGVCTFDVSKDGESFIVKGSIGEGVGDQDNSFTFDFSDGNESIKFQSKKKQLEDFIQECKNDNVLRLLLMDFPLKKLEGENKTEKAEMIRNWIFGPDEDDLFQEQADSVISDKARVDLTMTKDILNYKQEIYTEEDGAMVIKRSLNEHWIVYDLSEAKVTTNMEDNHLQVVMEEWDNLQVRIILELLSKVEDLKAWLM